MVNLPMDDNLIQFEASVPTPTSPQVDTSSIYATLSPSEFEALRETAREAIIVSESFDRQPPSTAVLRRPGRVSEA